MENIFFSMIRYLSNPIFETKLSKSVTLSVIIPYVRLFVPPLINFKCVSLLVIIQKTLEIEVKTLVIKGNTFVPEGKTLMTEGKTLVTK